MKPILQINSADETFDTELTSCIVSADAWFDSLLEPHDLTVPASVPQNVKDSSVHFAAWLFRKRRDPAGADAFKAEAEEFLQAYVESQSELAFVVVSDE